MNNPLTTAHGAVPEEHIAEIERFFTDMTPAHLDRLDHVYSLDAAFKDPFNEVQGVPAIADIFTHMFESLDTPRFVITQHVQQGPQCFVTWDFLFAMPQIRGGQTLTIRGASHLVLREEQGTWRVAVHRDYWDAAEELYEKLPLLGSLMRWLKRRANR
jgi:ketosteroid isomerase-like protein